MEFSLASFPSEILDMILRRPSHSYLVIDLWMTGDPTIIEKLSSGLTYLCLSAKEKPRKTLPQILGSLRALRILKLKSHRKLVKAQHHWSRIIQSLPKTLKTLIIDSEDSNRALLNYAPDWFTSFACVITEYDRGLSEYVDLGTLFPRLETLVLEGNRPRFNSDQGDQMDVYASNEDLRNCAAIPDTVTHLGLPDIVLGNMADGLKLTFLDTHLILDYGGLSLEEIHQDWDTMPHLEKITSLEWCNTLELESGVSWLPRTLRAVSIENIAPHRHSPIPLSLSRSDSASRS